jgi:hypothetical protein
MMNPVSYTPATYDTGAINAAIILATANGVGIVDLPGGVYSPFDTMGNPVPIIGASNVTLRGARSATIIRIPLHTVFNAYLVNGIGCNDFHVIDITFDMGDIDPPDDNWPTTASGAILLGSNGTNGGTDCSVENCKIINAGRYGIVARGGTRYLDILNNKITRTVAAGAGNVAIMFRKDGGAVNVLPTVIGNKTENMCGFGGAAWYGTFAFGRYRGSGFGANFELDADPNCVSNIMVANICLGLISLPPGLGGDGMELWDAGGLAALNVTDNNAGWGLTIAGRDYTVIGHRSANNTNHGIYIDGMAGGSAHNTFLDGCKTRGNGGSPYHVDSGIVGTVLGSNDFR